MKPNSDLEILLQDIRQAFSNDVQIHALLKERNITGIALYLVNITKQTFSCEDILSASNLEDLQIRASYIKQAKNLLDRLNDYRNNQKNKPIAHLHSDLER